MTQLFPSIAGQNTLFEGKFETDMVNSGERLGLVQNIESISTKFSYPRAFEGYWWKKKQICKRFKDPPRFQRFIYNQVKNII